MTVVSSGRIIKYDRGRGFGFIAPDEGSEDVFVHVRDVDGSEDSVVIGTRVQFSTETGERGLRASHVQILDPPPAAAAGDEPAARAAGVPEDDGVEVITVAAYQREITDILVSLAPSVTGAQIVEIREKLSRGARSRGWIE